MGKKKKNLGGRPFELDPLEQIQVRARKSQQATWQAAADAAGVNRSAWIRETLDAAAKRINRRK